MRVWGFALAASVLLPGMAIGQERGSPDWTDETGRFSLSFAHLGWEPVSLTEDQRSLLPRSPQFVVAAPGPQFEGDAFTADYCQASSPWPAGDPFSPADRAPATQEDANRQLRETVLPAVREGWANVTMRDGVAVVSKEVKGETEVSIGSHFMLGTDEGVMIYVVDCLVWADAPQRLQQARAILGSLRFVAPVEEGQ
jgi:hypothetical protein